MLIFWGKSKEFIFGFIEDGKSPESFEEWGDMILFTFSQVPLAAVWV